ncbi:MAG: carotenoid biosynthesis protein [Pseudomonadota bacterium]
MPFLHKKIQLLSVAAFGMLLLAMAVVSVRLSMETMFAVSALMFLTCALSAAHLFGPRNAMKMIPLAVAIGLFAEYMGTHYGWFFGEYTFTDALGPRLFDVPVVIPLMWFNITYLSLVLGNIVLFRAPLAPSGLFHQFSSAFFCAMLVTAYDLGTDPYMVFVAKAWIMKKTDGAWFGETLQGFVGWLMISFLIALIFNAMARTRAPRTMPTFERKHALIPILIYTNLMLFQMMYGQPLETRTIAFFAMGIPLMAALFSFKSWGGNREGN